MRKIVFNIIFLIFVNILFILLFRIFCDLLGNEIHYFNYKLGIVPLYTIVTLDFIPILMLLEDILFITILKFLSYKIKNNIMLMLIKTAYYYFLIISIYFLYFLIISYLEFYGITGRLPLSLYDL